MKKRYKEQQIAYALKQFETDMPLEEVTRHMGILQATFYNWKKRYGGLTGMELQN
jgi:putative transposase